MATRTHKVEKVSVLVGVCGGIAAYKVADLVSRLRQAGLDVHVSMSAAAQEFVTPLTFAAVSANSVRIRMFPPADAKSPEELYPHLFPAAWANVFILAPATADMLGRIAGGLGDDVVCAAALSLPEACLRFVCPAMNAEMWSQPVVQANLAALERAGWRRIGPEKGWLACGTEGEGRMAEPADIEAAVRQALQVAHSLKGRRVLILSGPTREHLDPVRFFGNPSSGKMGRALAQEALARGAAVDFVTGPVSEAHLPRGPRLKLHPVVSAQDMLAAAKPLAARADAIIFAAAVADYAPAAARADKLPRSKDGLSLQLRPTPDIAAELSKQSKPGQVRIGFALQTDNGEAEARRKLQEKKLDGIVLNPVEALGADAAAYRYLAARPAGARFADWGALTKSACARRMLDEVTKRLTGQ